jgi:branched-chain amino acid transport system permease protein
VSRWAGLFAAILACGAAPALLPAFYVTLFGYVGLAALVSLGLVLLTGVAGQTSFGQASFVGLAAYATAVLSKFASMPPPVGLLAGLALTGATAWLLGLITARLSGHFLALCSVAWAMSFFALFGTLPFLHGFNGIGDIPALSLAGFSFENRRANLAVIWVFVALTFLLTRNLLDSRTGRAIRALNGARVVAASVGVDPVRLSRTVFVLAALYAALAGWLFAHFQRFISPTPFSLAASIDYLFMVIIGGSEWLWGAIIGAGLVTVLRDQLNDWMPRLTGQPGNYESVAFSLVVIFLLQRAPLGLWPMLRAGARIAISDRATGARRSSAPASRTDKPQASRPEPARSEVLVLDGVSRSFGGLDANQNVSFTIRPCEIVALIGPNGAGKTTLFNIITGVIPPSGGSVRAFGAPITGLPPQRIATLGLARTFQHVKLLGRMSVRDNVALGAHLQGRAGVARSMLRLDRTEEAALLAEARWQAERVGLADVLDRPAADLPLGRQRLVEVARALCVAPRLLLLDEPAAGLRHLEKRELARLLRQLRDEGISVLLVEHDMDFVMQLADRVVVMDFGRKIAEGSPERVQADPVVLAAYLGAVA